MRSPCRDVLLCGVLAVSVLLLMSFAQATPAETFLGSVATEMGVIEDDVRTGMLPAMAGILTALVLVSVGIAVVSFFTRNR